MLLENVMKMQKKSFGIVEFILKEKLAKVELTNILDKTI